MDVMSARNPGYRGRMPVRPSGWNPLTSTFATMDRRHLTFVLLEPDRYWRSFCEHIDRTDLIDDPRFCDAPVRNAHADELLGILHDVFASRTYADWCSRFATFDGAWEPFQRAEELYDDDQVVANGYVGPAGDGGHHLVAPPAQFDETPVRSARAPEHGEHTEEVLLGLGLAWDDLAKLKAGGVIL